jgi:long-chain-fatty-acid--CoA ligase ACSBG
MRVTRNKKLLTWTYEQYFADCCNFGKALIALNITPHRSVNIIGFNAPEWSITFYGSIFGNCLPVGIYTTNGPEACHYVASHSEAEVVVVENQEHLKKFLQIWQDLPLLKYVVVYNDKLPENIPAQYKSKVKNKINAKNFGK